MSDMCQVLCQKLIHLFALNSHNHLTTYITLEMINLRLTVVKELAQGPRDRTIWDGMEAQMTLTPRPCSLHQAEWPPQDDANANTYL